MDKELTYEFTKDPALLQQYYIVREKCYKEVWGLKVFSGAEDEHDRKGHLLIVRNKNSVIGGGRLVLRPVDSSDRLPLETENLHLNKVLHGYNLEGTILGEIGRIAVLPEFRGGKVGTMSLYLLAMAQMHQCNYLTTVAPLEQAKKYRLIAEQLNIDIQIMDNVMIADRPYYNQIEMKLLVCDLATVPD
ncbi:MAG: GNAT family N-acetyltransferase, partial [Deltaproteobacteria bacterium]|nr:GNAT family N-acetyltransferase [Deltaproteobacteria bacterium]